MPLREAGTYLLTICLSRKKAEKAIFSETGCEYKSQVGISTRAIFNLLAFYIVTSIILFSPSCIV